MIGIAAVIVVTLATPVLRAEATDLYRARNFPAAERAIRASLRKQPSNPSLQILLARTLVELNRIPEALVEVEKVLNNRPSTESEMEIGRLFRYLAERRFRDLSRNDGGRAAVNEIAGRRLERDGKFSQAFASYQEAQKLEPSRPGISYLIGGVQWKMRELEAAEKSLGLELERNPDHGMANFRLGQVLMATNREAESVGPFERAVTAMPDRPEVRRELGKAYRKVGRQNDARIAWEAVANSRPNDDQIHFLLGGLYRDLGEPVLAQRELSLHRKLLAQRRSQSERD